MTYNVNDMTSLKTAMASIDANIDIIVTESFIMTERVTIPEGKDVTITSDDGGPYTITRGESATNDLFYAHLINSAFSTSNIILDGNKDNVTTNSSLISVTLGSIPLNINEGTILKNNSETALFTASRLAKIEKASFLNNTGTNGGAVYASTGSVLNINDATFIDNTATNGGAIYSSAILSIENSIIKNNIATTAGGAIYHSYNKLIISDCEIINNTALDGGGAYFANYYPTDYTIDGNTKFISNIAENNGGAIWIPFQYVERLKVESNVEFSNNSAKQGYLIDSADISMHDNNISTKNFTTPFKYGYNNYDISYNRGTLLDDLDNNKENIKFPCIEFTEPGEYYYTIRETSVSENGWTTDEKEYPVVITVTADKDGNLVSSVDYPEGKPVFTNKYTPHSICVPLAAVKIAIGAPLKDGQFTFGVFDRHGNQVTTATNTASGQI